MEKEKAIAQAQEEEIEDVFEYIKGMHFGDIKRKYFEDYPEYEDSIQWAINTYDRSLVNFEGVPNIDAERCDKDIKYCPGCNKCWEIPFPLTIVCYYVDFIKYDRGKELCPRCRDSQERLIKED